jgi:hypothetical protein
MQDILSQLAYRLEAQMNWRYRLIRQLEVAWH